MNSVETEITERIIYSTLQTLSEAEVSKDCGIAAVMTSTCKILELIADHDGLEPNSFIHDTLVSSADFWNETHKKN